MSIRLSYLTPVLAAAGAAAAAVAITVAPTAWADPTPDPGPPTQSCTSIGTDTQCESPGNVQINDSPGPVQYGPQYPYWEGDFFGGGHRGGHR